MSRRESRSDRSSKSDRRPSQRDSRRRSWSRSPSPVKRAPSVLEHLLSRTRTSLLQKAGSSLSAAAAGPTNEEEDGEVEGSPLLQNDDSDSPLISKDSPRGSRSPRKRKAAPQSQGDSESNKVLRASASTPQPEASAAVAAAEPISEHDSYLRGCRSVAMYDRLNTIDEGTFGVVHRAREKETGRVVALKRIKVGKDQGFGGDFPVPSLREINLLLRLRHPNIVHIYEIVVGKAANEIYMCFEYMDHDLKMLMRSLKTPFHHSEVKCLLKQLLSAVDFMHQRFIIHRDLKTSNLLLNNHGILKVCDFGLARVLGEDAVLTTTVVTLHYRAPELLFGAKTYTLGVDMWSVGCIFSEFLTRDVLIKGNGDIDQVKKMMALLGTPKESEWPELASLPNFTNFKWNKLPSTHRSKYPVTSFGQVYLSEKGFDLMSRMLAYNPAHRITASEALAHPYWSELPKPQSTDLMPTFPSLNEQSRGDISTKNAYEIAEARRLGRPSDDIFFLD